MSKFDLSFYNPFPGRYGQLLPVGLYECLPTDYIRHQSQILVRINPMNVPVMHPTKAFIRHFEVPMRLLWDEWEDFITGKPVGPFPTITVASDAATTQPLLDYLGIDLTAVGLEVSALPVYAFNLIYNEHFRDGDLQPLRTLDDCSIPQVAWEKDPFTSARPYSQMGPSVSVPMSGQLDVKGLGFRSNTGMATGIDLYETGASGVRVVDGKAVMDPVTTANSFVMEEDPDNSGFPLVYADGSGLEMDILDLRKSSALQRFAEARMRYGSRYVEFLRYRGVKGGLDQRLQLPQYLGGGSRTLSYSEVLATADAGESQVGDLRGHGISAMRSNSFRRYFQDFGYVMSLFYIRPKTVYMNAVDKHWLKRTPEEFFQKELNAIGAQEILNSEVKASHADPTGTFGFGPRYYDYHRVQSRVTGQLRNTLNYWTQARDFSLADPALNASFIECNPSERIFQDQTANAQQFVAMVAHSVRARRPVKKLEVGRLL